MREEVKAMKEKRKELRYKIMTILYQIELYQSNNIEYDVDSIIHEHLEEDSKFVNNIVSGVVNNKEEINKIANNYMQSWTIDRLGYTDRAILRMAIYEILYTDTPDLVCIDSAIELSKKYSDDKVVKMINGVLDKVFHSKEKNE